MNLVKRDFDKEAASWDAPPRVKLAEDVARSILRHVPLKAEMDILDFGCGTGLVSLALLPKVRSVTGVDSSQGMLDVFNAKVFRGNISRAKTVHLNLDKGESLPGFYHVIVTSMALHHIKDIKALLDKFSEAIFPGVILSLPILIMKAVFFMIIMMACFIMDLIVRPCVRCSRRRTWKISMIFQQQRWRNRLLMAARDVSGFF